MSKRTPKYTRGDEVHVSWIDSTCRSGWASNEPLRPHRIISTGFIVDDTPAYITLASDLDQDSGGTGRVQSIPKGCITNVLKRTTRAISSGFFLKES